MAKKGDEIVNMNLKAVDNTLDNLFEIAVPNEVTSSWDIHSPVPAEAPEFVKKRIGQNHRR